MIVVGGMTRLTDSGLSITEWRPVTGALPPIDAAAWEAEFAKYRATPQYEAMNPGMTLGEFKTIYWWEWGHRQLGRAIGAVWAPGLPLVLASRGASRPAGRRGCLASAHSAGCRAPSAGGWSPPALPPAWISVASYRLAMHLGLAFVILGLIAWYVLRLGRPEAELLQARRQRNESLIAWGTALVAVAFAQILLGALVAGIDAGRNYTDWPLMGGEIFPSDRLQPRRRSGRTSSRIPAWCSSTTACSATLLFLVGLLAWLRSRRSALVHIRGAFAAMMGVLTLQVVLGIVTVLYGAPLPLAIVHQLGAVALFILIVRARFAALYPQAQRIARG